MTRIGWGSYSSACRIGRAPLALAIALGMSHLYAATIMVDSADVASEAGKCTIVDAVTAVNTATAQNNCIAGDGNNDTIDLTGFTTPTTITFSSVGAMTSHALMLTQPATITGGLDGTGTPLMTLTRSSTTGTAAFGIVASTAPLTIDGLNITNGDAGIYLGGGVNGGNTLTITSSVISGNNSDSAGGGIAAEGRLMVQNSTISGNVAANAGGGIYANAGAEIYYSTVANNSVSKGMGTHNGGGGVFGFSSLTVIQSDISNNSSAAEAGGAYCGTIMSVTASTIVGNSANNGDGGGLYCNPANMGASITVTRSTIDNNTTAQNGGGVSGTTIDLENSTVTGNVASGTGGGVQAVALTTNYATIAQNRSTGTGGGVSFSSSASVQGTIIYGNTSGTASTPDDIFGAVAITGQYDLIGASSVKVPDGTLTCNPLLEALADNGGPTQTMALDVSSCAINAASDTPSVATDQRGYYRPTGTAADIGAYETSSSGPDSIFANGFED